MSSSKSSKVTLSNKNYLAEAQVRNHFSVMDLPVADGGDDTGATPMEYLLTAIGGCVTMTLRIYAEHKDWDLGEITVNMKLKETQTDTGIVKSLVEEISFEKDITENQRTRLLRMAGKCPVAKMVKGETLIESVII